MKIEKKRRVVITGLGTVNPTGNTVAESWAAVKAGRCAVGPITAFDTTDFKVKLAAEVKDFDPAERIDRREARKMARFTQFAVAAADEAIQACRVCAAAPPLPAQAVPMRLGMRSTVSAMDTRTVCSAAAAKAASARWGWAASPA